MRGRVFIYFGIAAASSRMQHCTHYVLLYLWIYHESLGDILQSTEDDVSCEESLSQTDAPVKHTYPGPQLAIKATFPLYLRSSSLVSANNSVNSTTVALKLELFL